MRTMMKRCSMVWMLTIAALSGSAPFAVAEPLRDVIDREIAAAWTREKVTPAKPADDAEFVRRVYLDLVGDVPSYDETLEFLDDKAADKRAKLIDRLLDDPRYGQHMADVWDLLLFGRNPPGFRAVKIHCHRDPSLARIPRQLRTTARRSSLANPERGERRVILLGSPDGQPDAARRRILAEAKPDAELVQPAGESRRVLHLQE